MNFKKNVFLGVVLFLALAATVNAGHYYHQEAASIYLDGKVHIRFDQLKAGWSHDYKTLDNLRYTIVCLAGKAVLNNVEYLDAAIDGKETSRWMQNKDKMNVDFSAIASHLEKSHIVRLYRDVKMGVTPFNMQTGKFRFHIFASGRNYKVTWEPKTGKIYAAW